jgi:hypothetical protein
MTWLLLAAVVVAVVVRVGARRNRRFAVSPSNPISTFHMDVSRRQTRKTRDALDAASSTLR